MKPFQIIGGLQMREKDVLRVLKGADRPMTAREVAEALGDSTVNGGTTARRYLNSLAKYEIVRAKTGDTGNPLTLYWEVVS